MAERGRSGPGRRDAPDDPNDYNEQDDGGRYEQDPYFDDDPDGAAGSGSDGEPDVLLDVPNLKVDEIHLEVDDLNARVSLQASVLQLLQLHVGADVSLGRVELEIKGVDAKAQLKVRLANVARIIYRVMQTIDDNPQILTDLTRGLGAAAEELGQGAGQAVGEVGEGAGHAAGEVGRGAGRAADEVGQGAGRAVDEVGEGAEDATGDLGERAGRAAEDVTGEARDTADAVRPRRRGDGGRRERRRDDDDEDDDTDERSPSRSRERPRRARRQEHRAEGGSPRRERPTRPQ